VNRTEALDAAKAAVAARRAYGPPEQNFARIAALWSAYLVGKVPGTDATQPVSSTDVAAMMALMKIARIEETPSHEDSWVDLAGYAACGAEVSARPKAPVETRTLTASEIAALTSSRTLPF